MNLSYIKKQLQFWADKKDVLHVKKLLTKEDQILVKRKSEELIQNIFTFDKPWDMERCQIPYKLKTLDWNIQLNDDEEWCFMLNRMDYLNYLVLSDHIEYAKTLILNWIEAHPTIQPEPSTRTLDTGIRLMNFFEALPYLYANSLLSDEEITTIAKSMLDQCAYLKEHYIPKYITSNWGSIQTCAMISILPMIEEQSDIYAWAFNEWKRQIQAQVYPDGMHWEQSTMYHIEVLNYCMKAMYYSEQELPQIHALARAIFLQATPHKEIETFGDTDRSNIQDVMTRASFLFNEPTWKSIAFLTFDMESLYTLGAKNAKIYLEMQSTESNELNFDGKDSGMYTSRSSWKEDANFTMFTNGSLGSGHGHSDNLHVSIYYKGNPVCIDTGRLTYREDHPLRVHLKSMASHNGVIVDEHCSCVPKDSWGYEDFGVPLKNYVYHKDGIHYYEGTLLGHDPLQVWTRKVIVLDVGVWMIVDEVKEDGSHHAVTRFHLDPEASDLKSLKLVSNISYTKHIEPCSLRYNEELEHDVLYFEQDFTNHFEQCICFVDKAIETKDDFVLQNNDTKLDNTIVHTKKFILSEDESYSIAIFHKEIYKGKKVLFLDGEPFHCKVFVVHKKKDKVKTYIVRA